MGHLLNKSEINLGAADLLHKHQLYPAVAHCAYYSCVQLMRHIWINRMGNKIEELANIIRSQPKEGSHEVLINQVKTYLKSKKLDDRKFNNEIIQLKKLRTKSDYDNIQIGLTVSTSSITLSKSAQSILRKAL